MKFIKKLDKVMTFFEEYIITILLFLMTVVTFWGVINRFFLKESLPWSEELARYLSIWAALIGASLGVKKGVHIGVEAFVTVLPARIQEYVSVVTIFLSLVFCTAMAYIGYDFSLKLMETEQLSAAMRIPIVIAYAAIPAGTFLMAVRYAMLLVETVLKVRQNVSGSGGGNLNG